MIRPTATENDARVTLAVAASPLNCRLASTLPCGGPGPCSVPQNRKRGIPLNVALAISSLLILLLVAALIREVRLRRALQVLLRRLLSKWRKHVQDKE